MLRNVDHMPGDITGSNRYADCAVMTWTLMGISRRSCGVTRLNNSTIEMGLHAGRRTRRERAEFCKTFRRALQGLAMMAPNRPGRNPLRYCEEL
jgi:hypothetical protein